MLDELTGINSEEVLNAGGSRQAGSERGPFFGTWRGPVCTRIMNVLYTHIHLYIYMYVYTIICIRAYRCIDHTEWVVVQGFQVKS